MLTLSDKNCVLCGMPLTTSNNIYGWCCTRQCMMARKQVFLKLTPTGIEALVCQDISDRQQRGINKYGTTVEDNQLTRLQWLNHLYEELLDAAIYAKKQIVMIEKGNNNDTNRTT